MRVKTSIFLPKDEVLKILKDHLTDYFHDIPENTELHMLVLDGRNSHAETFKITYEREW